MRGPGYDLAANMTGIYAGVQARIKAKEAKAIYVHCATHNLKLILSDVPEVRSFFGVLENLYTLHKALVHAFIVCIRL